MIPFPKQASARGNLTGRRGLPLPWVMQMYDDYERLGSVGKVARLHGRSRQAVWQIFHDRGLKLNPRPDAKPVIRYRVRKYSRDSYGYWRDTIYRGTRAGDGLQLLHHVVWIEHRGPIPPGHDVGFKDGNRDHWQIGNLVCCEHGEMTRRRSVGQNQFTRSAPRRLALLIAGKGKQISKLAA